MYKLLTIFFTLFIFSQASFANCATGFACNINALMEQEQIKQEMFLNVINKYFERSYPEKNYITNEFSILNYNDIFIFNTIM